jgi:hypothetical protein
MTSLITTSKNFGKRLPTLALNILLGRKARLAARLPAYGEQADYKDIIKLVKLIYSLFLKTICSNCRRGTRVDVLS